MNQNGVNVKKNIESITQRWSLYSLIWDFSAFWDNYKYKNMNKITQLLENVVRCKYVEVGFHIKNPIKNSYQDGLGRTTQIWPCCCGPYIHLRQEKYSDLRHFALQLPPDYHALTCIDKHNCPVFRMSSDCRLWASLSQFAIRKSPDF